MAKRPVMKRAASCCSGVATSRKSSLRSTWYVDEKLVKMIHIGEHANFEQIMFSEDSLRGHVSVRALDENPELCTIFVGRCGRAVADAVDEFIDQTGLRAGIGLAFSARQKTVEAQKKTDEDKRWKIPAYQVLLALEHRLQTWVVVVSFSRRMSYLLREWSEGPPPKIDALILDIDNVPVDAGRDPGNERPTAAVLAAALHGSAGNLDAARAGLRVALGLPQPQRDRYANTVLAAVPKPKRNLLMRELPMKQRDELMDIERRSGTYLLGRDVGRKEGRKEGRMALIEVIFAQLASRGIAVDARSKARIRKTQSLSLLQRWALRAAQVASLGELFEQD